MASSDVLPPKDSRHKTMPRLERQLKDYVEISKRLIWQRQAIFLAAAVLTAFYFDPAKSFACYGAVLFTEVLDLILARQISNWTDGSVAKARKFLFWILTNTALSAGAICLFVVTITLQQDIGGHFTPLFFLFAAALFAAMNNHQLLPALILRLILYGATFLFIALLDIWRVRPPIASELWLHFFTILFVMYFIIDCSFVFLRLYRQGVQQMDKIKREHELTKEAYQVKSQFISTVSHELRTPLTSIKGALDLINSGALGQIPTSMRSMLHIAGKNSQRLANLIDDILDIQKIEAGEMVYRFKHLDIRQLLINSVEANRGYADSLGIQVDCYLPDGAFCVRGDEARLMQVMANLLSNALKFSDQGGSVEVLLTQNGNNIEIAVQDHGIGIPKGFKQQVFEQFSQIDGSDQRRVGGTGLGMNITKQIVERHGGTIDFHSELGVGTTFFVTLAAVAMSETQQDVSNAA